MAKSRTSVYWKGLFLLPLPLLWAFAMQTGALRPLDNWFIDQRFRVRGEIASAVKVIYVDIDTQSLSELGNFPWPRDYFAQVASQLIDTGGAKAVGIDVLFSERGVSTAYDLSRWVESNREFGRYLAKDPPVVVAASFSADQYRDSTTGRLVRPSLPLLREELPPVDKILPPELPEFNIGRKVMWTPPRVGLIDTIEGDTRWIPLFAPTAIKRYDHLALDLALLYWGVTPEALKIGSDHIDVLAPDGTKKATIPLVDGQLLEVNWFSPWLSDENPRIGFSTVFTYARMLADPDEAHRKNAREFFHQFEGSVVLIGPVDSLLQDLAPTSLDPVPVPRVGLHGNVVKTLVSGQYLRRPPLWAMYGLTVVLTLLVAALAMAGGARSIFTKVLAVLALAGYVVISFRLFSGSRVILPMAAPLGAALSTSFFGVIWQLVVEERQKGRIKNMFGTYLAPELVNRMVESETDPQLGGHEEIITAYFSDIQSFSTFSELMPPAQLVELMNEYLTVCTDIVQEEGGTLDKYIGDAVVAIFGAPVALTDHAFRACVATQRVQLAIDGLRRKWRGEQDKWPDVVHVLRARLGLNTGTAIIGNMGSRTRFSYTMMGDNVNLAARMESGAKSLGVYTMVTEATKLDCEKHGGDRVVFRPLDRIVVKGRSQPVPVFEVVGLRENVPAATLDCLQLYGRGMERYLAQDWAGALEFFAKSAALEPNQPSKSQAIETNPSLIMTQRCLHLQDHPPGPGWDGVYVMKEK